MTVFAKQENSFAETRIDDEFVLMVLDSGEFFSLAGTAGAIWRLIDGTRDRDAVLAGIAAEYDAPEARIAADLDEFLGRLEAAGLIASA